MRLSLTPLTMQQVWRVSSRRALQDKPAAHAHLAAGYGASSSAHAEILHKWVARSVLLILAPSETLR